jgi:hypothetical protein
MIFDRFDIMLPLRNWIIKSFIFITLILSTLLLLSQLVYAYVGPIRLQADSNYVIMQWEILDSNDDVVIGNVYYGDTNGSIDEGIDLSNNGYTFSISCFVSSY